MLTEQLKTYLELKREIYEDIQKEMIDATSWLLAKGALELIDQILSENFTEEIMDKINNSEYPIIKIDPNKRYKFEKKGNKITLIEFDK